ncbi:MAG: alpha/beta hydrolase-fold protein [Bacteroidota bacterium]|nr:alpha/beta hydrolase-fold protein [Bacteroidota bacterium]
MQNFFTNQGFNNCMLVSGIVLLSACGSKIKENNDSVYSRHLQKHIDLYIISTPVPNNKSTFNLLLLNDGQDAGKLRIKNIVDSLYKKKLIQPLVVVAINAFDREKEYGVAGYADYNNNGTSADKYGLFIENELLPFVKKMTGVRKFNSITIAGCSLGGLSAFDVAWDHADKIDKVGVFSGSFWLRDKDQTDPAYSDDKDRIMINKIRSSRKRPHLKYWFYAGGNEETADRDKDGIIDVIDDTKDVIETIKKKNVSPGQDINYTEVKDGTHDYNSWSAVFPQFLIWAEGK